MTIPEAPGTGARNRRITPTTGPMTDINTRGEAGVGMAGIAAASRACRAM